MNITVWSNFSKRQNSTKIPSNAGNNVAVYLKENTSIRNPSFILSDPMPAITYVQAFGNYYFVTDIVNLDARRSEVICTMDVLATYRANIMNYTCYVERSSSNYDVMVPDGLLSTQQDLTTISTNSIDIGFAGEMYVVPVAGLNGIQYVVFPNLSSANFFTNGGRYQASIGGTNLSVSDIIDSPDAFKSVFKQVGYSFLNPTDYMGVMMAYPFEDNHIISATLSLGIWSSGTAANMLSRLGWGSGAALSFPASQYTDFRAHDPNFTRYSVYLPGLGDITLSSLDAAENDLSVELRVDYGSGGGQYIIKHSNGSIVGTYNVQIGCVVPYGKSDGYNFGNTLTTAMGGAMNFAGGAGSAASIIGLEKMGGDTIRAAFDSNPAVYGGAGSITQLKANSDIICTTKSVGSKEFPLTNCGRPLCQNVRIGLLSGFCKCGNASGPVNARDDERAQINSYLNSGFYVE